MADLVSGRSILVHVDDHPRCEARIDFALRLAQVVKARLVGVYLQPGINLYPFAAAMLPPDFVEERLRQHLEAQQAAQAAFAEAAGASGVATGWVAPAGDAHEMTTIHARFADFVVLGQPEADADDHGFANDLAHAVLMGSARPVLFVPYAGRVDTVAECGLVAWKNTREAARAVGDAMPLLSKARTVSAISVVTNDDTPLGDVVAEQELNAYFASHGVSAQLERSVAPEGEVGQLLLSRAADAGADLIVMGGYSHRRIRELVLGGVTRTMLKSMSVPVLMSH